MLSDGVARRVERVSVDTTVQAKAIAFAADAKPICRAIQMLGRVAKRSGIMLRNHMCTSARRAHVGAKKPNRSRFIGLGGHACRFRHPTKVAINASHDARVCAGDRSRPNVERHARGGTCLVPDGVLDLTAELVVPQARLERARPCEHQILSLARLPVPPLGLGRESRAS